MLRKIEWESVKWTSSRYYAVTDNSEYADEPLSFKKVKNF
jgi:hypothetical protein